MVKCRIAMRVAEARKVGAKPLPCGLYETELLDPNTWHESTKATFDSLLDVTQGFPAILKSPLTEHPLAVKDITQCEILNLLDHPDREKPINRGGRPRKTSGRCTVRQAVPIIEELVKVVNSAGLETPQRATEFLRRSQTETHVNENPSPLAAKSHAGSTSKHPGVCYVARAAKWKASIRGEYLGVYATEEEAIAARALAEGEHMRKETTLTGALKHFKS